MRTADPRVHQSADSAVVVNVKRASGRREAERLRSREKLCRAWNSKSALARNKAGQAVEEQAVERVRNPGDGTYREGNSRDEPRVIAARVDSTRWTVLKEPETSREAPRACQQLRGRQATVTL
jgi:hypothetical protein